MSGERGSDVGKVAYQTDTGVYYRLTDDSPITWVQVSTAPYKRYVALLTQSGTNAPVATVLENTLGGTVVWTRADAGSYVATLAGAFTENKTVIFSSAIRGSAYTFGGLILAVWYTVNSIALFTRDSNIVDAMADLNAGSDGILFNTGIEEIRVYP